jgi:hypothetical protein
MPRYRNARSDPYIGFPELRGEFMAGSTDQIKSDAGRIMYMERKAGKLTGDARIGRVTFSKSGQTLYYRGQTFRSLKGAGFKSNYLEIDSGEDYWISGPRKDGADRLYGERIPVEIDDDVREEYWSRIRGLPGRSKDKMA